MWLRTKSSYLAAGGYFIKSLLDMAAEDPELSPFLTERLDDFKGFGGVRIEDVVTVTADGMVNWTVAPRTVGEIESVMAGGEWPPKKDEAPWANRQWEKPMAA